jgi:hypothetical protein
VQPPRARTNPVDDDVHEARNRNLALGGEHQRSRRDDAGIVTRARPQCAWRWRRATVRSRGAGRAAAESSGSLRLREGQAPDRLSGARISSKARRFARAHTPMSRQIPRDPPPNCPQRARPARPRTTPEFARMKRPNFPTDFPTAAAHADNLRPVLGLRPNPRASSKPAGRRNPALGKFDSFAASSRQSACKTGCFDAAAGHRGSRCPEGDFRSLPPLRLAR